MYMEFDEMKKIWDTQEAQPLYAINEAALHKTIVSKKTKGLHISNITELLSIVINPLAGGFILITNILDKSKEIFLYILAGWMIVTGVYCFVGRVRRKRGELQYDRTMLGDLDHAVAVASYQVNLSTFLRFNNIPIIVLILLSVWSKLNAISLLVGLILFFGLAFYASGWEHRYYKSRLRELQGLRNMILNT
jgi:uncharacterized membrane protein YgdD (TMEM256/DUF423 family)